MALKDVKDYYYTMLSQYLQTKEDLQDFEQALKDGYITEDRLSEVKEDVNKLKENLDRIQYIMYLWELPNKKAQQPKYRKMNHRLEEYFKENCSDLQSIQSENASVLNHLRQELKKLK